MTALILYIQPVTAKLADLNEKQIQQHNKTHELRYTYEYVAANLAVASCSCDLLVGFEGELRKNLH